jgi:hypothetical protein
MPKFFIDVLGAGGTVCDDEGAELAYVEDALN